MGRRMLLGMLAYLLPSFPIGFLWHLVLFHETYVHLAVYRPDPIIPFGLAAMLVQAIVFSWSYPRLFSTERDSWKRSALGAFVVFSTISWSFTTLAVLAKHPMNSVSEYFLVETAFTLVQFVFVAPLIALAWRSTE